MEPEAEETEAEEPDVEEVEVTDPKEEEPVIEPETEPEPQPEPEPEPEPITDPVAETWVYPFEEAGVGDQYYVVLNLFSTIYRAETAREMAEEATGEEFFIRYERSENLFKVYSGMMEDATDIHELFLAATDGGFTESDVWHGPVPGPEPIRFKVQIESFATEPQALEALEEASERIDRELSVEYDDLTRRYTIRTGVFSTLPETRRVLRAIQDTEGYSGAFIVSSPRLFNIPVIHPSRF